MKCDSFGLIFGVNSFVALLMQSLLTRIVNDKRGFAMGVRNAFLVYAGLHLVIAAIFLCSVIFTLLCYFKNTKNTFASIPPRKYGVVQRFDDEGFIETDSNETSSSHEDATSSIIDGEGGGTSKMDVNANFMKALQKAQSHYELQTPPPLAFPSFSLAESFSTSINNMRARGFTVNVSEPPRVVSSRRTKLYSANF